MKYQKNKGFLPRSFVERKLIEINNSNKRAMILLLILNSVILPLNLTKIQKDETLYMDEYRFDSTPINVNQIAKWLQLPSELIDKVMVENGEGELYLKNPEDAYDLEENGFIIKSINNKDEDIIVRVKIGDL